MFQEHYCSENPRETLTVRKRSGISPISIIPFISFLILFIFTGIISIPDALASTLYKDVIFFREDQDRQISIPDKTLQISGMKPVSNLELLRKIPLSLAGISQTSLVIQRDQKDFQHFLKAWQVYWKSPDQRIVKFSWNTKEQGVASALWQVSTLRFSPDTSIWDTPPGLVASGIAPLETKQPGRYPRVFFIDFGLFAPKPPVESKPLVKPLQIKNTQTREQPKLKLKQSVSAVQAQKKPSVQIRPDPRSLVTKQGPLDTFNMPYYVRLVPLDASGTPVDLPSEAVTILYGDPIDDGTIEFVNAAWDKPDAVLPGVRVTEYFPIRHQHADAIYHVIALKDIPNPFGGEPLLRKGAKLDLRNKRDDKKWWEKIGDFFSDVVDWVTDAVNWVSKAYDSIQKTAVDAACSVAGEKYRGAFEMGLNIGMAAMGVPPAIPNFDELTEMGTDYLVEMAVEQATGVGVDPAIAREAAERGVDALQKELEHHTNGGGSGAWYKPDPDYYYRPAYMNVEIRNNNKEPSFASLGTIRIEVEDEKGMSDLFHRAYFRIPSLKPGERITLPVYLKENLDSGIGEVGSSYHHKWFWERYNQRALVTVLSGVYDTVSIGGGSGGGYKFDNNERIWQHFRLKDPRQSMNP